MIDRAWWGALAVVVACTACSDDSLDVNVDLVTSENFCSKVAEVVCRDMFICCTGSTIEDTLGLSITTAERECRRDAQLLCERKNYLVLHAIDKGTAAVKEDKAPGCLKAYLVAEHRGCFVYASEQPWDKPCEDGLFEGLQQAGGSCLGTVECLKDHYCAPDRKCKALPKLDEPCPSLVCVDGLYCDFADGKCKSRKGKGEDCNSSGECAKDHRCKVDTSGMKQTCEPLAALGQPCSGSQDCKSGYCLPGLCSDGKSCYQDADCQGLCEGDPTQKCMTDSHCQGKCSSSGGPCYQDYECPSGEQCQRKCIINPCAGKRVCDEKLTLVDYCAGPLSLIKGNPAPTP